MQLQDPTTPRLSPNMTPEPDQQPLMSYTEFYDERVMTQEIEALTLISNTQEIATVPTDDDSNRA